MQKITEAKNSTEEVPKLNLPALQSSSRARGVGNATKKLEKFESYQKMGIQKNLSSSGDFLTGVQEFDFGALIKQNQTSRLEKYLIRSRSPKMARKKASRRYQPMHKSLVTDLNVNNDAQSRRRGRNLPIIKQGLLKRDKR